MTKPWSEPAVTGSRIIAAEHLPPVTPAGIGQLGPAAPRRLSSRDLGNETARAAYALGRRRGFEEGSRLGLQQGYTEGSQALDAFQSRKAQDVAQQMQQMLTTFRSELAALEAQVASDLVSLAIDIAREVLRREPATDPAGLLPAAREALRALAEGASRVEIHASPSDAAWLRGGLPDSGAACTVREDPAMPRGGLRVDADTGLADAGFEARWQAAMHALGRDEEPLP